MIKHRWTSSEGEILIQQWQESGMDKKSFCKVHGIAYSRMLYWCKRISSADGNTVATPGFVRLEVLPGHPSGKISITGPNGLTLHIDGGEHTVSFIKSLLTA